jgi:hypothetical protein
MNFEDRIVLNTSTDRRLETLYLVHAFKALQKN